MAILLESVTFLSIFEEGDKKETVAGFFVSNPKIDRCPCKFKHKFGFNVLKAFIKTLLSF